MEQYVKEQNHTKNTQELFLRIHPSINDVPPFIALKTSAVKRLRIWSNFLYEIMISLQNRGVIYSANERL